MEAADIAGRRNAVFVIGVDRELSARGIGDGDDRAVVVGDEIAPHHGGDRRALIPEEGRVGPRPVDIAAEERSSLIFGDERVAVIKNGAFRSA